MRVLDNIKCGFVTRSNAGFEHDQMRVFNNAGCGFGTRPNAGFTQDRMRVETNAGFEQDQMWVLPVVVVLAGVAVVWSACC